MEFPTLNFFENPWYWVFTSFGFWGYWLAKFNKWRLAAKEKRVPFHYVNCGKENLPAFLISGILTYSGNMILCEYSKFVAMELAIQWMIISGLSWGGGSGFKYAVQKVSKLWKKFVDKWEFNSK